jgi:uncharacterized membrane protein YgcG
MKSSLSPWPVVIVVAIWAAIVWAGTQGEAEWSLLGAGGVVATVLVALVETMRLVSAGRWNRERGAARDDSSAHIATTGYVGGSSHADPSSGGHAGSGDGGGGSDGGGGGGGDGGGGGGD